MRKVILVGGSGQIGRILRKGLSDQYEFIVVDKNIVNEDKNNIKIDVLDYTQLNEKMPQEADVLINLLSIPTTDKLVEVGTVRDIVDTFLIATYYLYMISVQKGYKKYIYSSSVHAVDFYEANGVSNLGREINVNDYPFSHGLYGILKLASENIGHAFSQEKGISVINLRIAAVREDESDLLMKSEKYMHTCLSNKDVQNLYRCAIETNKKYGTYFGVSNNPGKPWDIGLTIRDLGFSPTENSTDILRRFKENIIE